MSVDWYRLLDVPRDASSDEIRAAWKAAIADLDPTDRTFRVYSQAAEVLLDPERRSAYDASLPSEATTDPVDEPAVEERTVDERAVDERAVDEPAVDEPREAPVPAARAGWQAPLWLLGLVGGLALVVGALALYLQLTVPSDEEIDEQVSSAQAAAEKAAVPVLSYDYRRLEQDHDAAVAHMTDDYREDYDRLFTVIEENAPELRAVVTAKVVASAITRTGEDRAEILLFVDRPTSNTAGTQRYRDQVTFVMEKVGGTWLVDEIETSPAAP